MLLLDHGAEVEVADANGRNALHYAFLFGDIPIAAALLMRGGNMFRQDVDGRAVVDYARAIYGDKDVKAIAPLASVTIFALLIGLVFVAFLLLSDIPILGEIVGPVIFGAGVLSAPLVIVRITEHIFSYGVNPLLVRKITARQTALSAHINSLWALRQGGNFADGGVLYLRSFDFDGSFFRGVRRYLPSGPIRSRAARSTSRPAMLSGCTCSTRCPPAQG
jgi:hypothetical protein